MNNNPQPQSDPRPSMLASPIPKPALPKHLMNEETVTMIFPHKISINLDNYMGLVHFEPGLQEVPISLKDHWALKQQGVKIYVKQPELTDDQLVEKLKEKGYQVAPPAEDVDEIEDEEIVSEVRMPATEEKAAKKSKKRS